MRTSTSQFEVMVEFMETHGDLSKPGDGPHGRVTSLEKWAQLTECLNLDTSGTSRSVEKWKKVWSDFKNNTKRKAARIHRAAIGTGGGPACKLILTDLEQRVLNLIGSTAATGLVAVPEVGDGELMEVSPSQNSVTHPPQPPPPPTQIESSTRPGEGDQSTVRVEIEEALGSLTPHATHASTPQVTPNRRQHEPRRRRVLRRTNSGPTRLDNATQLFINSNEQWRQLVRELVTEHIRLRERELERDAQWQILFTNCLSVVEKFINK